MEQKQKVNKTFRHTKWSIDQQILLTELEAYPFMLQDARRLLEEQRCLINQRMECDMPSMVHQYCADPGRPSGISDPMFNIAVATENIDKRMADLRLEQDDLLTRHTRLGVEIKRLTPAQAAVIRMRHLDRYRWVQIQDRLNCSETQLRNIYERGIERLTSQMMDWISKKKTKSAEKCGKLRESAGCLTDECSV